MCLPARLLKYGIKNSTTIIASAAEIKLIIVDSERNWKIRSFRVEPTTFLTPTSLARFADRAVERLTKLIQAKRRINNPMAENI